MMQVWAVRAVVTTTAVLMLNGCLSGDYSAPETPTQIGPFNASYYNNATFVASESVERPSINYSYSNFNGIDSNNFHAIWTGTIKVFDTPKFIDINFDVSWSDVSLYIDGVAVSSWSNTDRIIRYEFSPGTHDVAIDYNNNYFATEFNVSFTTNVMYTRDQAISLIAPQIDNNTKIIYVGCYESGNLYNNSTVTLGSSASKVFLFLTSYDSLNWVIENPNNVTITGIAYSSYSTVSTVTAPATIPTYEIAGLTYGYSNFSGPIADITYLTGRAPDATYGTYGLTQITIPVP